MKWYKNRTDKQKERQRIRYLRNDMLKRDGHKCMKCGFEGSE